MSNDEDIFLALKLHDYWFQPDNYVAVRFATSITVVELVFIAVGEIVRVRFLRQPQLLHTEEEKKIPQFPHKSYHRTRPHRVRPGTSK